MENNSTTNGPIIDSTGDLHARAGLPGDRPIARLMILAAVTAVLMLGDVLLGAPLFQTLGFEYSGIAALVLSMTAGLDAVLSAKPAIFSFGLGRALLRGLLLSLVPIAISLLSLLWLPNCALEDGLLMYAQVAVPTALLAAGFGYGFRLLFDRKLYSVITFLLFWLITLLLSLLPGYTNAQLYTYGWQYGYFPGFVWDRAVELKPAYLAFRLENVLWLVLLLSVVYDLFYRASGYSRFVLSGLAFLATVALMGSHDNLGITASQSQVRESLRAEAYLGGRTWIYYAPGTLTEQEVAELQRNVPLWLASIRETFGLHDDGEPIHLYLYPDAPTMEQLVGTRAASIAKPWLGEVHLMKSALGSLKHELTHVVLRTIGNFPFYASWSTGLTEGAAVAAESPDAGLFTTDELAAQLIEARMASGVSGIMQFTGFASDNSAKSYTLAGSFAAYLIRQYGPRRFDAVYGSLDYEHEYHKSLNVLEREWKLSLAPYAVPLDSQDVARLQALFGAPSIFNLPCVRRLGKLERQATLAFEHDNYGDAYRASREAFAEGGGASDAWNTAHALILLGQLDEARRFLDTATVGDKALRLGLVMGDLDWIAGDTVHARTRYSNAVGRRISSLSFFTAYDRLVLLDDPSVRSDVPQYLLHAYRTLAPDYQRSISIVDHMLLEHVGSPVDSIAIFDRARMVLHYIQLRNLEGAGLLKEAAEYDPIAFIRIPPGTAITSDDSLAIEIVERHMWRYRAPSHAVTYFPKRYQNAAGAEYREMHDILRTSFLKPEEPRERERDRENDR